MKKLLLIDGNSIMNRAFYGIMTSKMLSTDDGKYTNALYGFLSIMFKNIEEVNPDYMMIAFDSKTGANVRKQKYEGYKKSRHGMPTELAEQMPEIKEILTAMNIKHIELENYEGDDILGTAAKKFASSDLEVYILSGDRDLFQLVQDNIYVRIPRTKFGKTETIVYDKDKVFEEYGLQPEDLIDLKALMGDSSDEIPGCPGVGPKTATDLLKEFKSLDELYKALESDELSKGIRPKLKEKLIENKDLVDISKIIGTIDLNANINCEIHDLEIKEWNKEEVLGLFKYYKFNRFIARFDFDGVESKTDDEIISEEEIKKEIQVTNKTLDEIKIKNRMIYYLVTSNCDNNKIIKKEIDGIAIFEENNILNDNGKDGTNDSQYCNLTGLACYVKNPDIKLLKNIFQNDKIEKVGFNLSEDYVILRENGIQPQNLKYDIGVAVYDIDPTNVKHKLDEIAMQYLNIDLSKYISEKQVSLFDDNSNNNEIGAYIYIIRKLYELTYKKLKDNNSFKLFNEIEMPLVSVLGEMQYAGMQCDKTELIEFGKKLKERLENLTSEIYELAGEEFNINSTQQLGTILFDKLGLTAGKKNKKGYSTDVSTLEKIENEHPIVSKVLEYRGLTKLNSTYVDGLVPYINDKTGRIHSYFHQTITATGRISSTEPNLQNIPTRDEFGKNIKKAFKPKEGYVYIDADYSQVELRVLAHIAQDKNMINAFNNDEDIHREVASRVFETPLSKVTSEQRSRAKAVNFGIVYGITAYGLAKQIGTTNKEANEYINSYLKKYNGVKSFMDKVVEQAKEKGYVETLFGRRRYIPELKSNNYMVREFGKRAAMNTPIQGTAADIMKIAMNNVYKELNESKVDAKIILQVHDELIIEAKEEEAEEAKNILKSCMQNAMNLDVPLKVELCEAKNWYDAK